ncbi:hypothetical protein BT96DRAFT_935446 [Gymnopus androsaceus JB14]|uniref:ABM domain-containing protein n=1 Tax=Gymnopus androsaceus JB14 TaxID=1447944 RepID=A0A6A4I2X7_9AGAR|nr:hypothetical protein BT96DRAFT_935446 [Gymnopus androsaceus JB14]
MSFSDLLYPKTTTSGKLVIMATLKVLPGNEDRMAEVLHAAQSAALLEAATAEFRVTRLLEADGTPTSTFMTFRSILKLNTGLCLLGDFAEHLKAAQSLATLKAFTEEGIMASPPELNYCNEI